MEFINLNATAAEACNSCVSISTKLLSVFGLLVSLIGVALGGGIWERVKNLSLQNAIYDLNKQKLEIVKATTPASSMSNIGGVKSDTPTDNTHTTN